MLLKAFKSNQPLVLVIIPIIAALAWYNPFNPSVHTAELNNSMPLYNQLITLVPQASIFSKILGLIFIITIGLYLSRLNTKFIFIPDRSYLPSIIYLIIVLGFYRNRELSPIFPATFLILISIERLLETFKNEQLTYKIFDASLFIGLASLFYFNSIFLILFIWSTLLIIRPFFIKEWLYSILGLAVCYFVLFGYNYLNGNHLELIFNTIRLNFTEKQSTNLTSAQIIFGTASILLLLLSSQYLLSSLSSKKIFTRKTFNLFLILFLIIASLSKIIKSTSSELIIIAAIPLSALFSHYFILARHSKWLELLFIIFIICFLITQFKFITPFNI